MDTLKSSFFFIKKFLLTLYNANVKTVATLKLTNAMTTVISVVSNSNSTDFRMSVARCITGAVVVVPACLSALRRACVAGSSCYLRKYSDRAVNSAVPLDKGNKMYVAEERGSAYAPDYRVYFSEYIRAQLRSSAGSTTINKWRDTFAYCIL